MADDKIRKIVLEEIKKHHKKLSERKLAGNGEGATNTQDMGSYTVAPSEATSGATPQNRSPDLTSRDMELRKFIQTKVGKAAIDNGTQIPGNWPIAGAVEEKRLEGDSNMDDYRNVPALDVSGGGGGNPVRSMLAKMATKAGPPPQDMSHAMPDEPTPHAPPQPPQDMEHAKPDSPDTAGDGGTPQEEQDTGWVPPKNADQPGLQSIQPQASYQPPPAPAARPAPSLPAMLGKALPSMLAGSDVPDDLKPDQTPDQPKVDPQADVPKVDPRAAQPAQAEAPTPPPMPAPYGQPDEQPAPQDNRAMYGALQGVVNNAWAGIGQKAPEGGYYNAKIAQENEQQKGYQDEKLARAKSREELVRDMLKQKFESGQNDLDRGVKARGLTEQERKDAAAEQANALKEKDTLAERASRDADRDAARAQSKSLADLARAAAMSRTQVVIQAGQDKQANKDVDEYNKTIPNELTVQAIKRITGRLQDLTPISGFDAYQGMKSAEGLPIIGGLAGALANSAVKDTEMEGLNQDSIAVMQQIAQDTSGKVLNESEIRNIQKRLGTASGQGETAYRRAMGNEWKAIEDRANRYYAALSPKAQEKVDARGIRPDLTPTPDTGYAPKTNTPEGQFVQRTLNGPVTGGGVMGTAASMAAKLLPQALPSQPPAPGQQSNKVPPELADFLTKKFGQVPPDATDPARRNIYAAQAMQDPAFRELIRKQNHID